MYKEGKYTKEETCRLTLDNILTCPGPNRSIDKLGILLLMEHSSLEINDVDKWPSNSKRGFWGDR